MKSFDFYPFRVRDRKIAVRLSDPEAMRSLAETASSESSRVAIFAEVAAAS